MDVDDYLHTSSHPTSTYIRYKVNARPFRGNGEVTSEFLARTRRCDDDDDEFRLFRGDTRRQKNGNRHFNLFGISRVGEQMKEPVGK